MEPDARRRLLRAKFLSLGLGELAAVAAFAYVALGVVAPKLPDDRSFVTLMVAFVPLLLILAQAAAYWLMARAWVKVRLMPRRVADLYRAFRILDVILVLAAGVYITFQLPSTAWVSVLTLLVWLFAVLEFVNYYVVRLSYPVDEWFVRIGEWRTPRLICELRTVDHSRAPSGNAAGHPRC